MKQEKQKTKGGDIDSVEIDQQHVSTEPQHMRQFTWLRDAFSSCTTEELPLLLAALANSWLAERGSQKGFSYLKTALVETATLSLLVDEVYNIASQQSSLSLTSNVAERSENPADAMQERLLQFFWSASFLTHAASSQYRITAIQPAVPAQGIQPCAIQHIASGLINLVGPLLPEILRASATHDFQQLADALSARKQFIQGRPTEVLQQIEAQPCCIAQIWPELLACCCKTHHGVLEIVLKGVIHILRAEQVHVWYELQDLLLCLRALGIDVADAVLARIDW